MVVFDIIVIDSWYVYVYFDVVSCDVVWVFCQVVDVWFGVVIEFGCFYECFVGLYLVWLYQIVFDVV